MTVKCNIDRDSFQQLLADAFEVQESRLDSSSLSALIDVHRLVTSCESNKNEIMQLIAERVRTVAGADGAAIALLRSSKLVYQAGSGTASSSLGRQVTAVLSPSAHGANRSEILRVENAENDIRIEASICREFEAQSLVLLPIYNSQIVAGVLQISYATPHGFERQEIRTYRLIARLIEDLISQQYAQLEKSDQLAKPEHAPLTAGETTSLQQQTYRNDPFQPCSVLPLSLSRQNQGPIRDVGALQSSGRTNPVRTITRPEEAAILDTLDTSWRSIATLTLLFVFVAYWPFYVPTREFSQPGSGANELRTNLQKTSQSSLLVDGSGPRHLPPAASVWNGPGFKRIRVGPNEIDYVTDDVTIRHFLRHSKSPTRVVPVQVVKFADDVTIRYFDHKPEAIAPTNATVAKTRAVTLR